MISMIKFSRYYDHFVDFSYYKILYWLVVLKIKLLIVYKNISYSM